eukprot:6595851-Pyramimonas_sp.AAC.1
MKSIKRVLNAGIWCVMCATGAGRKVYTWVVDDEAALKRSVDLGLHGVVSNRPAAILSVLRMVQLPAPRTASRINLSAKDDTVAPVLIATTCGLLADAPCR